MGVEVRCISQSLFARRAAVKYVCRMNVPLGYVAAILAGRLAESVRTCTFWPVRESLVLRESLSLKQLQERLHDTRTRVLFLPAAL